MLYIRQGDATRQPPIFSTTKYTTPSLCCRQNGATYYVPLVQSGGSVTIGTYKYTYSASNYPRLALRYNGATYYVVNTATQTDGILKPSTAIISTTSYGSWTDYQYVNQAKYSRYRNASATISVTAFAVQTSGTQYRIASINASGSSSYYTASGSKTLNATYTSSNIGTQTVSVTASTSYRPAAGSGGSGSTLNANIPMSISIKHANGTVSQSISITWVGLILNQWE